jgi:hypothetical protein
MRAVLPRAPGGLAFSAPVRSCPTDTRVVFLGTDVALNDAKILEVYALRWSIEDQFTSHSRKRPEPPCREDSLVAGG